MWTVHARDGSTGKEVARAELRAGSLRIGRHSDNDLQLPSASVSRKHARIELRDDGRTELHDEGSANGCSVDGDPVHAPVRLSAESVIRIGIYILSLKPLEATISPMDAPEPLPPAASIPKAQKTLSDLLEHQIGAIQSHRSTQADQAKEKREAFEAGWKEVLEAARDLRGRFQGDARVPYFFINRDQTEIVARVIGNGGSGTLTMSVARTGEGATVADPIRAWFRVMGEDPVSYTEPEKAMSDFVKKLAARLA